MRSAKIITIISVLTFFFTATHGVPWAKETDTVIIEKNLFRPDRQRWDQPEDQPNKQKKKGTKKRKKTKRLALYGTVITDDTKIAVINIGKRRQKVFSHVVMVGDSAEGYRVKEIDKKKVVLLDEDTKEEMVLFLNEGKEKRSSEKTSIKDEKPQISRVGGGAEKGKSDTDASEAKKDTKKKVTRKKAQTNNFLKRRLKKSLDLLKKKESKLVKRQAEKDYAKLKKLMHVMSDEEKEEVQQLKSRLDDLNKE